METYRRAFEFIERVKNINTTQELTNAFDDLLHEYGFVAFCIGNPIAPKIQLEERIWVSTWPEEWAKAWMANNWVAVDPVVYQILAARVPFRWRDVRARADKLGAGVMDAARDFKFNDGLGIPIRSESREILGVTMAGPHIDLTERDTACLHLAAIYFHARLELLSGIATSPRKPLSGREKDCLAWASAGKTDWEISQILGVAEETVKVYMKHVLKKLNATHRAQAVAIGIHTGQIAP